jgi:hypothetical protein
MYTTIEKLIFAIENDYGKEKRKERNKTKNMNI